MSTCARCSGESAASAGPAGTRSAPEGSAKVDDAAATWCKECERLYDQWSRRHAKDIVWQALTGTVIVSVVGLGLPLLGIGKLIGAVGAFAGFGTVYGLARITRRKRRQQFLQAPLPRAYLPVPK